MNAQAPVRSVRTSAYTVPTDAPEADGTLAWDSTTLVLVEVDAGGFTGTGWTYAPAAATKVVDEVLAPVVRGACVTEPVDAWHAMVRAVRNAGRPGLVAMAISAVDIAMWDACARIHYLPLARLWGSAGKPVEVYGSGGFTTYDDEQTSQQLRSWAGLGLHNVKLKIGEDRGSAVSRDLARVALAREVVGDGTGLFVDANGAYSPGQACRVGRDLDEIGVLWLEEPVTSDDLPGLAHVRDHVDADVAAGEYGYDLTYFEQMSPAVDCLQVDVTRCGGYTEWLRVAAMASARHLDLSGHCAPYITLPVASVTERMRHLEWFHDHVRSEQLLFEGCPDPEDSQLVGLDVPGHGLTMRHQDAAQYRVA
jgi:L-alanine-DL-glutamate epimerase-like enolase superfamily enzyme